MHHEHQLFLVELGDVHVVTWAFGREGAKRNAHNWIGNDKEKYTVTPLTDQGDIIHLDITLWA